MSPTSPKVDSKTRVVKPRAAPKPKAIADAKAISTLEKKAYFIWLHFQLKEGDKPNHAAVAAKLGIPQRTSVKRLSELRLVMEQIGNKQFDMDLNDDPVSKVFDNLEKIFAHEAMLR